MKTILITIGDPAGCGPLITLDALSKQPKNTKFIVVGDEAILARIPLYEKVKSRFTLIDAKTSGIETISPGQATRASGKAALGYLAIALEEMRKNRITRLVTAPISKEAARLTVKNFCGHTEYLADHFKIRSFEMMMVSQKLKIVLMTRHIDLGAVSRHIRAPKIARSIALVHSTLQTLFGLRTPRIALASINPHAGIHTFLKKEEKEMQHAIRLSHIRIAGPLPADTLFTEENLKKFDCVLCGYHDQGMIPFKLLSFKNGVNLTLGLPIIRTSPSHGVAYDAIRNGTKPFSTSMTAAIDLARRLSI